MNDFINKPCIVQRSTGGFGAEQGRTSHSWGYGNKGKIFARKIKIRKTVFTTNTVLNYTNIETRNTADIIINTICSQNIKLTAL